MRDFGVASRPRAGKVGTVFLDFLVVAMMTCCKLRDLLRVVLVWLSAVCLGPQNKMTEIRKKGFFFPLRLWICFFSGMLFVFLVWMELQLFAACSMHT